MGEINRFLIKLMEEVGEAPPNALQVSILSNQNTHREPGMGEINRYLIKLMEEVLIVVYN
jgi:hypothetical protein